MPSAATIGTMRSGRDPWVRRWVRRLTWIGLLFGTGIWFYGKVYDVWFRNSAITAQLNDRGMAVYWGGLDSKTRSMHAWAQCDWPESPKHLGIEWYGDDPLGDGLSIDSRLISMNGASLFLKKWFWERPRLGLTTPHANITTNGGHVFMPMGWFPIALALFSTTQVARLIFRRRPQYPACPRCRYNLTGNSSGRCPECGEPVNRVPSALETKSSPSAKV